jgi:prepilin-type processing-associated H-X9-DG protein
MTNYSYREPTFTTGTTVSINATGFMPIIKVGDAAITLNNTATNLGGIFGRVNVSTTYGEVRDGLSHTIMTGELQRITDLTPMSKDGWVIGGPASLFTTGAMFRRDGETCVSVSSPSDGALLNNGFFGSPGSDHPGGANIGLGDGSVEFVSNSMDPNIFALLGSMSDGLPSGTP